MQKKRKSAGKSKSKLLAACKAQLKQLHPAHDIARELKIFSDAVIEFQAAVQKGQKLKTIRRKASKFKAAINRAQKKISAFKKRIR
jgi:predicted S18 family serine protease